MTNRGEEEGKKQDHRGCKNDDFAFSPHQVLVGHRREYYESKNQAHADDGAEAKSQGGEEDRGKNVPKGVSFAANQIIHALKGEDGQENHFHFLGVEAATLNQDGHEHAHHGG